MYSEGHGSEVFRCLVDLARFVWSSLGVGVLWAYNVAAILQEWFHRRSLVCGAKKVKKTANVALPLGSGEPGLA